MSKEAVAEQAVPTVPTEAVAGQTVTMPGATPKLKKLSFGKIATAKADTKTQYPVLPSSVQGASELAGRVMEQSAQFEALKGALETNKAELKFMVLPYWFRASRGKLDVPSSMVVKTPSNEEVLVTFPNKYGKIESEEAVAGVIGAANVEQFFTQAFSLTISGDKLPVDAAQEIINELQVLFAKHNCTDALEVKASIKPTADFHAKRHTALSEEQNRALDQVAPIVAMVKCKGRK